MYEDMLKKAAARLDMTAAWVAELKAGVENDSDRQRKAKLAIIFAKDAVVLVKALRIMLPVEMPAEALHDRADKIFHDANYMMSEAESYLESQE